MKFLDAESKGEMEVLAEKNKDIKMAYDLLQVISKDEKARMLYEAKYAEISDQGTRIKSAEEKGRKEGIKEGIVKIAQNAILKGMKEDDIVELTGLTKSELDEIRKNVLQ